MESQFLRANVLCFFLFSLIFSSHCPLRVASDGVNEGGDEFFYAEETGKGPSRWAQLKAEWAGCNRGNRQSPINIVDRGIKIHSDLGELKWEYRPAKALLSSRGYDVMVSWEDNGGRIIINGTDYDLIQCHWHFPSEHAINGKKYDTELHLVHQNLEGAVAVVGILYELGQPDAFLTNIFPADFRLNPGAKQEIGSLNAGDLDVGNEYYRYAGSLTTPPCSEGVIWTIARKIKTISKKQLEALKAAARPEFQMNARPLQGLNGREVVAYMVEFSP